MPVINTNMNSLISQNALQRNERSLSSNMAQLSTGSRINSARDDAAGLAISTKMTSQIKGLDMAVRNANDAISMIQTAEGALVEVSNMLQRMRELSVQSANDTYSIEQRGYMDIEFQQLKNEVDRVARNTEWNGQTVLTPNQSSTGTYQYQVGARAGQLIEITIPNFSLTSGLTAQPAEVSTGTVTTSSTTNPSAAPASIYEFTDDFYGSTLELNWTSGTTSLTFQDDGSFTGNQSFGTDAVAQVVSFIQQDAFLNNELNAESIVLPSGNRALKLTATNANTIGIDLQLPLTRITGRTPEITKISGSGEQDDLLSLSGSFNVGDVIELRVAGQSIDYEVTESDLVGGDTLAAVHSQLKLAVDALGIAGLQTTADGQALTFNDGNGNQSLALSATIARNQTPLTYSDSEIGELAEAAIDSADGASAAIDSADQALEKINAARANMGAVMNRLTHAVDNLTNVSQNQSASRSQIEDTDYAKTMSELARDQIIQQAATSMLAQANASQQTVLKLLQG